MCVVLRMMGITLFNTFGKSKKMTKEYPPDRANVEFMHDFIWGAGSWMRRKNFW